MHYISLINGMSNAQADDLMSFATDLLDGSSGIVASGDYAVAQSSPVAMSVTVATGKAYIYISSLASYYRTLLDAAVTLSIAANSSGSTRIDTICIKIDTGATPDADASNVATVVVVQGTPGAGAPATPANHYKLAEITVANGAVSIANAAIADSRTQLNIRSGIKVGGVTPGAVSIASQSEAAAGTENTKALTSLSSAIFLNNSIFRQGIIDGGCQVAQGAVANLSTSKAYGKVDLVYGIAEGTVGAGTITQTTSPNCGSIGTAFKLSGVTLTGSGKVKAGYRMEAKDAKKYKNQIASFSVRVYHDVGSAKNYKVYINKANSSDVFSAVTNISSSSNQLVNSATDTSVTFENIPLGDCSNGLEIQVECDCGAITTKNFEFTEFQFNKGAVVLPFVCLDFAQEIARTMRYYEKSYAYDIPPLTTTSSQGLICLKVTNNTIATAEKYNTVKYLVKKRNIVTPSIHPWTTPTNTGRVSASTGGGDLAAGSGGVVYENENGFAVFNNTGGTLTTDSQAVIFHFVADARL